MCIYRYWSILGNKPLNTPGLYKTPHYGSHEKPVADAEIKMIRELLIKQHTIQDIIAIMDRETGESYNWDRIDKIRKMIDASAGDHPTPMSIGAPLLKTGGEFVDINETAFGEDVKNLLMNIYKLDKMAEGSYVTLKAGDKIIPIDYHTIKDIITLIANCYDAEAVRYHPRPERYNKYFTAV